MEPLEGVFITAAAPVGRPSTVLVRDRAGIILKSVAGLLYLAMLVAAERSLIVPPEWVREQMAKPETVIVEVSWTQGKDPEQYNAGHVPGAIHLDTDILEDGYPAWRLRPLAELHEAIGKLGIAPSSRVIVYGNQTIAAARAWWVLYYAGVRDVRMLDGGYEAWLRAGYPGETKPRSLAPRKFTGARVRHDALATTELLERGRYVVADVRSRAEFDGETSGYGYVDRKGRIPGSVHAGDADDAAAIYQHPDGRLREVREIRALWRQAGLPSDGVVFTCGSGWRSSLAFLYAKAMGMRRVRNYSDGWIGWSTVYVRDGSARGSTPGWRQEDRKR